MTEEAAVVYTHQCITPMVDHAVALGHLLQCGMLFM
jgi:hypothetical protein